MLRSVVVAVALALLASPTFASAKGGAFRESPHGRRDTGVRQAPGHPRGSCAHCHGSPRQPNAPSSGRAHAQRVPLRDNELCLGCHRAPAGTWVGDREYAQSGHGGSPSVVWPGPAPRARDATDSGKCINCHDPHGVRDAAGLVPGMLVARGATLCLSCHSGNPAPDIALALTKAHRHPMVADPAAGRGGTATAPGRAAATCSACHNPHASARNVSSSPAQDGSRPLGGAARVRLSSGARGSARTQTAVSPTDTALVREHEVCFKCHAGSSGGARLDIAAAVNPANESFHPIEAQGRNPGIDSRAFARGWSADRLVGCSDCHSSDDDTTRGPHGSDHPYILKRRYPTGRGDQQIAQTDLCFTCHAYATYGDPLAGTTASFSRFTGHRSHAAKGLSCWACHDAHGSKNLPALIAQRSPGIVVYAQDTTGGSCTVSCHSIAPANVTYQASYRR